MLLSRRAAVTSLLALSVPQRISYANAKTYSNFQELAVLPPVPTAYLPLSEQAPMNDEFGDAVTMQGTAQPSDIQIKRAKDIVASIDLSGRPIDVMGQLLEYARGAHGAESASYTRAWPKDAPANPLILEFFRATGTAPAGDTTAWCAACLSWTMMKSRTAKADTSKFAKLPQSASSGFFRTWATEAVGFNFADGSIANQTVKPRQGDVVVFQQSDGDQPHPFKGHVGYFLDMDEKRVRVLGGNQFEGKPRVHAINVKWIPRTGFLRIHSIRTDASLY